MKFDKIYESLLNGVSSNLNTDIVVNLSEMLASAMEVDPSNIDTSKIVHMYDDNLLDELLKIADESGDEDLTNLCDTFIKTVEKRNFDKNDLFRLIDSLEMLITKLK